MREQESPSRTIQIVRLNVVLELGAITETVNVSAAVSPVNTTTAAVETLVETQQMLDLPIVGRRNVLSLAALMPSVTRVSTADGPGQQTITSTVSAPIRATSCWTERPCITRTGARL